MRRAAAFMAPPDGNPSASISPINVKGFDFDWEDRASGLASHPWSESETDQPNTARHPHPNSREAPLLSRVTISRTTSEDLVDVSEHEGSREEHNIGFDTDTTVAIDPSGTPLTRPGRADPSAAKLVPRSDDDTQGNNQNFPGGVRGRKVRRTLQNKGRIVSRHDTFERVIAYCIAHNFDSDIYEEALDHIWPQCRHAFFDDTLHVVQLSNSEHSDKGDVFLLSLGTIVFWGLTESEEQLCVKRLRGMVGRHEGGSDLVLDKDVQSDTLYFGYVDPGSLLNAGQYVTLSKDVIMLPRYPAKKYDVRAKLAVSMAMAQSVKLEYFEQRLDDTVTRTEKIPHDLALHGEVRMRRTDILKELGQIMVERNRVNLQNTFFDTPGFFWEAENEEFEPVFAKSQKYLDISKRLDVLNRKMDILKEVFDLLSDTLNKRHSVRLEWIVICLIILECCITVATFLYSEYQHSQQKSIQAAWGSYARKRGLVMMDALAFLKRLVLPQNFSVPGGGG